MKKQLILVFALSAFGIACDPDKPATDSEPKAAAEVTTEAEAKKEVKENVKDVLKDKGPKWTVTLKGGKDATVEGGILTTVKAGNNTTALGVATKDDKKGKAKRQVRVVITKVNEQTVARVVLTLDDGTTCVSDPKKSKDMKIDIVDAERKSFHAELSGDLLCDKAPTTFTAKLKK